MLRGARSAREIQECGRFIAARSAAISLPRAPLAHRPTSSPLDRAAAIFCSSARRRAPADLPARAGTMIGTNQVSPAP
jgi:hypothetical protein